MAKRRAARSPRAPRSVLALAAARPARPPTALTPEEVALSDAAVDAFADALGGRDAVAQTLALAETAPEVGRIVRLLIDPDYATWSLRRICHDAKITIADLFQAYQRAMIVKAHLQATRVIADEVIHVVQDVMARSRPHTVPCEACAGRGQTRARPTARRPDPPEIPCDLCQGTGQQTVLPDLDRQKVALQLSQLLQQPGGLTIAQTQNAVTLAPPGAGLDPLERFQQDLHRALSPAPVAVEGVVTPESPPRAEVCAPLSTPDRPPADHPSEASS